VINSIQDGKQPYITALDGRNALELVLSIYLSSKLGKPISLPLDSISTNGFK
jgi:hypothetical protein